MRKGSLYVDACLSREQMMNAQSWSKVSNMLDHVLERGKRQLEEEEAKLEYKIYWSDVPDADSWGDEPTPAMNLLDSLRSEIDKWHGNILGRRGEETYEVKGWQFYNLPRHHGTLTAVGV
jgi:hypothetical protein